jgi:hypothetical protein
MVVPVSTHPGWKNLLNGKKQCDFEFLAAKMTMGRLKILIQDHPDESTMQQSVEELREVFVKNINLPKVQRDLKKIFN